MTDDKVSVEIWKKIVDVQQHFNDLELRVRNFALVLTGAFLALGGYAIKETIFIQIYGINIPAASLIVLAAILPLFAFYFMDKHWYHRLLDGAVKAGIAAEDQLKAQGYDIGLGTQISISSPLINNFYGTVVEPRNRKLFPVRRMHSRHKMDVFYGVLLIALLSVSVALGVGLQPHTNVFADAGKTIATSAGSPLKPAMIYFRSEQNAIVVSSRKCPQLVSWLCVEGRCSCP